MTAATAAELTEVRGRRWSRAECLRHGSFPGDWLAVPTHLYIAKHVLKPPALLANVTASILTWFLKCSVQFDVFRVLI